jgi:hypothetical protein
MSLTPVTSHPRFTAASEHFQAALPLLNPTTRFLTSIPTSEKITGAIAELKAGIAELEPMTAPTDLWLHRPARSAMANAQQAIDLLAGPLAALAAGTVTPQTGSAETAKAVAEARMRVSTAVAAAAL